MTDPSALAVQGAEIRVQDPATGLSRTASTDENGWFRVLSLPPGLYDIQVQHSGFRTEVRRAVALDAGRLVRLDFRLQVGEQKDTVEVIASAPPLSLSPADWSASISGGSLQSLPLNGRDLFDLAAQLPGAQATTNTSRTIVTGRAARFSVNGSRPNQNNFRLDGVFINDPTGASPVSAAGALLGLETIREVQLIASPFDAEYGRTAGAVLTAVSKSGTNEWHGSAFDYARNSSLNARNFFDSPQEPVPPLNKHQFGGLISGPVRRNRIFFLTSYEGVRQRSSQTKRSVVPNADARSGKLPSGQVAVSAAAAPYLALYPLPNGRDYGDGTGEFISVVKTSTREDLLTGKADWARSDSLRFSSRYTFDQARVEWPEPLLIFDFSEKSRYHIVHNHADFFASPYTVYSIRAAFSRIWNFQDSSQPATLPDSLSFIPGRPFGFITFTSSLSGLGGDRLSGRYLLPRRHMLNDFQFSHTLAHARGPYSLRAGAAFDRVQFNQLSDTTANGSYTFSSLADFLRGQPASGTVMLPGVDTARGWRQNIFAAFIQYESRLTPRAGFSLGLRYETYSTPKEVNGKAASFPGDIYTSTGPSIGSPLFRNPSRRNLAPRAGFSYALGSTGRTVVRAGAGIFYDLIGSRELIIAGVRMPPFFRRASMNRPAFPNILEAAAASKPETNLDLLDYHLVQPYTLQYQLQIEHRLAGGLASQLGYAASRGVHLMGFIPEVNPNRPQILPSGELFFPETLNRLNPAFGTIAMRRSQFDSSYHSLQASLTGPAARRLRFQLKYAWSKSLDNCSSSIYTDFVNASGVPTMFNYRANRGRSDFDMRHVLAGNFSWTLPAPAAGFAKSALGGWELHVTLQAQSGTPFNPTVGFDRARLSGTRTNDLSQRPVLLRPSGEGIIVGDPRRWFDPEAFGLPPAGMLGNLGRNTLEGPGLAAIDAAAHKKFRLSERFTAVLRLECFNLTNHPNFQIPSARTLFDSSANRTGSAGQITSTTTPSRQIQLVLRLEY